jgi:hypothetical protein
MHCEDYQEVSVLEIIIAEKEAESDRGQQRSNREHCDLKQNKLITIVSVV